MDRILHNSMMMCSGEFYSRSLFVPLPLASRAFSP